MQEIPNKIDSKFRFVLIAAERAEQMMRGARPKIETAETKNSRIAVQEVLTDLVDWDYGPAVEPEPEVVAEVTDGAEEAASE